MLGKIFFKHYNVKVNNELTRPDAGTSLGIRNTVWEIVKRKRKRHFFVKSRDHALD